MVVVKMRRNSVFGVLANESTNTLNVMNNKSYICVFLIKTENMHISYIRDLSVVLEIKPPQTQS